MEGKKRGQSRDRWNSMEIRKSEKETRVVYGDSVFDIAFFKRVVVVGKVDIVTALWVREGSMVKLKKGDVSDRIAEKR